MEDVANSCMPATVEEEIFYSQLQLVLLSPTFLQFLAKRPDFAPGKMINPDRVVAVMLGVKDDQIKQEHKAGKEKDTKTLKLNPRQCFVLQV